MRKKKEKEKEKERVLLMKSIWAVILCCCSLGLNNLAMGVELPAGKYELIGYYNNSENTFVVHAGTEAEFKLYLIGDKTITSFLPESEGKGGAKGKKRQYQYYKISAVIGDDLINHDGLAELLDVIGAEIYLPKQKQFQKID